MFRKSVIFPLVHFPCLKIYRSGQFIFFFFCFKMFTELLTVWLMVSAPAGSFHFHANHRSQVLTQLVLLWLLLGVRCLFYEPKMVR